MRRVQHDTIFSLAYLRALKTESGMFDNKN
jgi:hypothetical protein